MLCETLGFDQLTGVEELLEDSFSAYGIISYPLVYQASVTLGHKSMLGPWPSSITMISWLHMILVLSTFDYSVSNSGDKIQNL